MIKLFKTHYSPLRRSVVFPKMAYVQKRIRQNIDRALNYYRLSGEAVDSSHPLVTILNSMHVAYSGDVQRYFDVCDEVSPSICGTVRIGTPIHNPILRNRGIFYGDKETVISVTLDRSLKDKWYDLIPVKVFSHGRTDISYSLPDGDTNTNEDSHSVIGVDVALLTWMWHNWKKYQERINPDNPQTTSQFIANFVLPNMLYSHNDCSWTNRVKQSLAGTYSGPPDAKKRTPFALATSETFTADVLKDITEELLRNQVIWDDALKLIPLPCSDNLMTFSTMPDFSPTRLGKCETCLRTLDKLELLVRCTPAGGNSGHVVELSRQIKRNFSERWFTDTHLRPVMEARLKALAEVLPA